MHIEEITIPFVGTSSESKYVITKWIARDGAHVTIGQDLYEMEIDGVAVLVESFDTGHIKIKKPQGGAAGVGEVIAEVLLDSERDGHRPFCVRLSKEEISFIDSHRGDLSRDSWINIFLSAAIASKNNDGEQVIAGNPLDAE